MEPRCLDAKIDRVKILILFLLRLEGMKGSEGRLKPTAVKLRFKIRSLNGTCFMSGIHLSYTTSTRQNKVHVGSTLFLQEAYICSGIQV